MEVRTDVDTRTRSEIPARAEGGLEAGFRRKTKLDDEPGDRTLGRVIALAKCGDDEAYRYLYLRFKDNVYGYVCSIVRDEHEAEDVTQQVFTKLLTTLPKYEPRGVPFSAWVLRVARNVALDHLRARRPIPVEEVRDPTATDESHRAPTDSPLRSALSKLPFEQRRVLVMRHVVGLSPGEIADQVGRTEASIHGLHHRGRLALQAELTSLGAAPNTRVAVA